MPGPTSPSTPSVRLALGLLAGAALLLLPASGAAAPGALLEITFGPSQTGWLGVDRLQVRLDGREIAVRTPAPDDPMGAPLYSAPIAPGPHLVEMTASLHGDSDLFTYVQDYQFTMKGHVDVAAPAGHVVGVHGRVQAVDGVTAHWTDRYRLALASGHYPSERAAAVEDPTPPPVVVAAAPRVTGPAAAPPPAACALAPVHFAFDQSALTPAARQALDQFAACLAAGTSPVRLDGHCDIRGSDAYNLKLGQRRVDAVARHLEGAGVAEGRISTRSLGESQPLCGEPTEACHARNRRVEAAVGN